MGIALVPGDTYEAELTRLMETYGSLLTGLCTAWLGDYALAQDVVQETFLRAYRGLCSYRGEQERSEKAWLTQIAVNLCRDQKRSRWFRFVDRKTTLDMLPEPIAPVSQEDEELFQAVNDLPEKEKQVVLLRYYQGLTPEETAAALGITRSSMYRRLDKAKNRLKEQLERQALLDG